MQHSNKIVLYGIYYFKNCDTLAQYVAFCIFFMDETNRYQRFLYVKTIKNWTKTPIVKNQ